MKSKLIKKSSRPSPGRDPIPGPALSLGTVASSPAIRAQPSIESQMVIELILTTFSSSNTLKAIAEISGKPADQFINKLPHKNNAHDRAEVFGRYRDFLQSFIAQYGVMTAMYTLLQAVNCRIQLNQKREETKPYVGAWIGTRNVIVQTIAALSDGKPQDMGRREGE